MKAMRKRGVLCRLTAALLCLCMLVSGAGSAFADETPPVERGYTDRIVSGSRKADPNTMDDYLNRLLTQQDGSRYAGRVWTDKTVFAYDANKTLDENAITLDMDTDGYNLGPVKFNADFAHVFSALASSQVVNEYPPSPIDLVIVFDMSGSMGQDTRFGIDEGGNSYRAHDSSGDEKGEGAVTWPEAGVPMADRIANSRVQATLTAINNTIDKLMAQNPQNRVAVCGYGANAVVLMPLAHYRHTGDTKEYLSVGGMETLYHPSDLVYKSEDDLTGENKAPGWYWQNNRDTCYTVVVNAGNQMSTYTDGPIGEATWTDVTKRTVSNNALDHEGKPVKAFPGVAVQDAAGLAQSVSAFGEKSKDVYTHQYGPASDELKEAMSNTQGLKADDYVGYFTNTQGGIYLAYKQLADSEATTYSEKLSNNVMSTVARIPAAIIMSDGGANFSFNEMGIIAGENNATALWNSRYGRTSKSGTDPTEWDWYLSDDSWDLYETEVKDEIKFRIVDADHSHRLGGYGDPDKVGFIPQKGDEWYKVFLPGKDTLDSNWNGVHGIYNTGADYYKDGTLTTQPEWNHPGVLFNSDNNVLGTSGTVLEVLLTASYMNYVVKQHYEYGWETNGATQDSRIPLSTYTMNVDTEHVPQWGRMRLYPTLNPKTYSLDEIKTKEWYKEDRFGEDNVGFGQNKQLVYEGLFNSWNAWKSGTTDAMIILSTEIKLRLNSISTLVSTLGEHCADYETKITAKDGEPQEETISVTDENVISNIAYNDEFYDVTSEQLSGIFDEILALILGKVFVPVSGDNDAGVGDSITYQDPLGEYMEIKHQSIYATPYHTVQVEGEDSAPEGEQRYDMALLVFGEMHGLVRTGVYDFQWNDTWMGANFPGDQGDKAITMGWYKDGTEGAKNATYGGDGAVPDRNLAVGETYDANHPEDAWENGWVYRFNYQTLIQYVPIVSTSGTPDGLPTQAKNTVYTIYRFACSSNDRNMLRRNPIYGEVPKTLKDTWADAPDDQKVDNRLYRDTPGVYRLSDIRVWVEDTGDFVDTTGAIAPNTGYDRSLYVNIPAAAVPTELAEITLGQKGVVSYKTNLGKDHKNGTQDVITDEDGKEITVTVGEGKGVGLYEKYCYQSTPFRLFYAVGLEENLIIRDGDGTQIGVDVDRISPEYIADHTVTGQDRIYFISNYYSNTPYEDYVTDTATSRTRGDPTVSFSPSEDNRYYVFQKPLPLYAHAYRYTGGTVVQVDGEGPVVEGVTQNWPADEHGNGTSTWEKTKNEENEDVQQLPGSWVGGVYMGVYASKEAFINAPKTVENGVTYIEDSTKTKYRYVEGGIFFLEDDLLRHVTAKSSSDGSAAEGSLSFSSDDYFFILVEYYQPDGGTGKDNSDNDVPGTQAGHDVRYAVARKGSEFGSAFKSPDINNGDMLCWTDVNGNLDAMFDYFSRSDTGDNTRGEPTFELLTCDPDDENALKAILEANGVDLGKKITVMDENNNRTEMSILDYWKAALKDEQVQNALEAAKKVEGNDNDDELDKFEFDAYFKFAVAARPGGIRAGNMANNRLSKSTNTTSTSYSYYLPTVSDNSKTDDGIIINNFLGNNGRLEIANARLHVTKLLSLPVGETMTDKEKGEEFNFQVFVEGITGERTAVKTEYNEYSGTWERKLAYVDVLTDNSDLLQDNSNNRAVFRYDDTNKTAILLVQGGTDAENNPIYYDANEDGTLPVDGDNKPTGKPYTGEVYYLYLKSNGTGETAQHVYRLYEDEAYEDKGSYTAPNEVRTYEEASTTPTGESRPAGTMSYFTRDAELIPVKTVTDAESAEGAVWQHPRDAAGNDTHTGNEHPDLAYQTILVRLPVGETSETKFLSPYKTRTQYLTVTLKFGENANVDDKEGGKANNGDVGTLDEDDLYDGKEIKAKTRTVEPAEIAQSTAEFTLKHGEGLLLTGLGDGTVYRFTEKLTEHQLKNDPYYTLRKVTQQEDEGEISEEKPGAGFTGVFSVFGDTGAFEEQSNFENTVITNTISIIKELIAIGGAELTEDDKNTPFKFTLTLVDDTTKQPLAGPYNYTITEKADDGTVTTVKEGQLLQKDVTATGSNIAASDDGEWKFELKAGQTMTVKGLPDGTRYTYTATEDTTSGDQIVEPGEPVSKTVTGTGTSGGEGDGSAAPLPEETFTNVKVPVPKKTETEVNGSADDPKLPTDTEGPKVGLGDTIKYQILWANNQSEEADVTIIDPLDDGVDFVSAKFGDVELKAGETYAANADKTVEIRYGDYVEDDITTHRVVKWVLHGRTAAEIGTVDLFVRVNEKAKKTWTYNEKDDGSNPGGSGTDTTNDYEVLNRALVNVGNVSKQYTATIENPVGDATLSIQKSVVENETTGTKITDFTFDITLMPEAGRTLGDRTSALVAGETTTTYEYTITTEDETTTEEVTLTYQGTDATGRQIWTSQIQGEKGHITLKDKQTATFEGLPLVKGTLGYVVAEYAESGYVASATADPAATYAHDAGKYTVTGEIAVPAGWDTAHATATAALHYTNIHTVAVPLSLRKIVVTPKAYLLVENAFTFTVTPDPSNDPDDDPLRKQPDFADGKLTVKNPEAKDGETAVEWLLFGEGITYEKPGKYIYTVEEVVPEEKVPGMIYDETPQTVTVEVKKDGDKLTYTVSPSSTLTFTNLLEQKTETSPGPGVSVSVGQEITYEIAWANDQSESAHVIVEDQLDDGVDFVSASFGDLTLTGGGTTPAGDVTISYTDRSGKPDRTDGLVHIVKWDLGMQDAGKTGKVTLKVKVNANAFAHWQYGEDDTPTKGGTPDDEVVNRAKVTIDDKGRYTNEVENPLKPGSLTVKKTVVGVGSALTEEETKEAFDFTVTLTPQPGVTLTYDVDNGITATRNDAAHSTVSPVELDGKLVYDFILTHDQSVTFENIPIGTTYTVKETKLNDYSVSVNSGTVSVDATGAVSGTITEADKMLEFTNKHVPGPQKTETDPGDDVTVAVGQEITYEIEWANDQNQEAEVVVEDLLDEGVDFVSASILDDTTKEPIKDGTLTADSTDSKTHTVPDTKQTIEYSGGNAGETHTVTWNLGTQGAGKTGKVRLTVRVNKKSFSDWQYTDDYKPGSAGDNPDYEVWNKARVTVGGNNPRYTNEVRNPVQPGGLKVEKHIVSDVTETGKTFKFTVTLTAPEGKTLLYDGEGSDDDNGVRATYDEALHTKVEPTPIKGETLKFSFELGDRQSVTFENVPVGTMYTVTEEHEDGYSASVTGGEIDITGAVPGEIAANADPLVFTNTHMPGPQKTETKVNDRDVSGELDKEGTDVTGPDVKVDDTITYKITWANDQDGAATVTVTDPLDQGVDFVSASFGGVTLSAGDRSASGTVKIGGVDVPVTISVSKDTTDDREIVTWKIGGELSSGEAILVPAGETGQVYLTVRVNAKAAKKWTYYPKGDSKAPGGDFDAAPDSRDQEVVNRATVQVGNESAVYTDTIHNPLKHGDLTVRKAVAGDGGETDAQFHFRVELSDKTISGTYGGMTFKDGVAEFTLRHGQSVTASGLPAGITYTVTEVEANLNGYSTTMTGAQGTIPEDSTAAAVADFVNTRMLPEVPKTGDDSRPGLWAMLACVSALCAALLLRRRNQGES